MTQINELAARVKDLEDQLLVCTRCGMCQSVCPLFEQTGREADVARGKLALLSGMISKIFSEPDGVNERLNRCLLCGSCADNCPSGVNVIEIFIRARAILTDYKGLSLFKKMIFRQMLANPRIFNAMTGWASKFQDLLIRSNRNEQGTSCARFVSPLIHDRHFMPMAKHPFHKTLEKMQVRSTGSGVKVLLFTGCIIDKIMPHIAVASVKALSHHNVGLTIPETQGCCGIPALASGDAKTFNFLTAYHLDRFEKEDFDYLVTACATCTSTIKKLWPTLYSGHHPSVTESARNLAEKTMDINQFLTDVVRTAPRKETKGDRPVATYHDPCHLKKSLGIFKQPRQLLTAAGYRLTEMEDANKCCGMGGSFNLLHYDISSRIGSLKQENIADTGCDTVASGCPACMIQISDMLSRSSSRIKVRHPVELYAQSLEPGK